jgi:hypothetical protein
MALLGKTTAARGDVSSWLFVGTGPSSMRTSERGSDERWSLGVDAGMGTPPEGVIVVGGLGRFQTHLGRGTDLALLLRTATHGFANGDWGGALDLGGYQRFWEEGSSGGTGSLVLGAPWGITLSLGASLGTNDARTFSALLGIDLARLTVYRAAGQDWWVNPFPPSRSESAAVRR